MTEITIANAGSESRQAMIRVWMTISAVWAVFWLALAAMCVMADRGLPDPLLARPAVAVVIIVGPPLALLAAGALLRLLGLACGCFLRGCAARMRR
jgi:hypothetical protein